MSVLVLEERLERIVHILDDDRDVRMSLRFQIESLGYTSQPFATPEDLLAAVDRLRPGCLLLDIRMPGRDGLQVMEELRRQAVSLPIIVMTGHADVRIAVAAMKLGAIEFLEKPFEEQQLCSALERGFALLEADRERRASAQAARRLVASLTRRERDVFVHLLRGEANKIVAHKLNLSVRTVEMHRANLLAKLGVKSLTEAAAFAAALDP